MYSEILSVYPAHFFSISRVCRGDPSFELDFDVAFDLRLFGETGEAQDDIVRRLLPVDGFILGDIYNNLIDLAIFFSSDGD